MQDYKLLKNFFGDNAHWQVNKHLARTVGLESAVLLADLFSKSIFFTDKNQDEDNFFFNTRENIENDTTLSPFQQRKCIAVLVEKGFLEVKEKGLPKKMYYKVVYDKLLNFFTTGGEETLSISNNNNKQKKNKLNNLQIGENPNMENINKEKKQVDQIIKAMEVIDPKNKLYYGNVTQRKACKNLIDFYTFEKTMEFIELLSQNMVKVFNPPTTPIQLRDNWVRVIAQLKFNKSKERIIN